MWPGVSMTRPSSAPTRTVSPSPTRLVHMGDALRFLARRDDAAFVVGFEFADAGGVIGVMMGHEDIREPPAGLFQRGLDRRRLRRIDGCRRAARRVVQQDAVIVLEAGEEIGLRGHVHPLSFRARALPASRTIHHHGLPE